VSHRAWQSTRCQLSSLELFKVWFWVWVRASVRVMAEVRGLGLDLGFGDRVRASVRLAFGTVTLKVVAH